MNHPVCKVFIKHLTTPDVMQVDKMVGRGAPEDFVQNLEELAKAHHEEMTLDRIRAYYFGQRFIVEMEVVLPSAMTVRESHDIAMILQHKVHKSPCCKVPAQSAFVKDWLEQSHCVLCTAVMVCTDC